MRILLSFIFIEFALIRCDQDAQQSAAKRTLLPCVEPAEDNAALQNLMGAGRPIENKVQLSGTCTLESGATGAVQAGGGIRYDQSKTCYIIGNSDLVVSAKWKATEMPPPGFESCRTLTAFQAEYVAQRPNEDTYMILDPTMAPWFFTTPLGGCEIFVATSTRADKRNKPIVIHSNLDSCMHKLQNLKKKGEKVDRMLRENPDYQNYKLAARVYSMPEKGDRPQTKVYFENYQLYHPGIVLKFYDTYPPLILQKFQFLCHYRSSLMKWKCILKGERDGSTQEVL